MVARPEHVELKSALGRLYFEIEDFASAEKVLSQIGPEQEAYRTSWVLRFESALWLVRLDWVQKIRDQVLHEMPEKVCVMARLFEDHGYEYEARRDYAICPESTELDALRMDFRNRGGELLKRFETVEPEETLNHHDFDVVSTPDRLRRRGVELRRAHRQGPGNCHVLSQLGHWYGQNQDQARSLRYLKEAYGRCPKNPAIVLSLAWAYLSHGQREQAADLSRWVLKQGFDAHYCNEALKVIELSDGPKTEEQ